MISQRLKTGIPLPAVINPSGGGTVRLCLTLLLLIAATLQVPAATQTVNSVMYNDNQFFSFPISVYGGSLTTGKAYNCIQGADRATITWSGAAYIKSGDRVQLPDDKETKFHIETKSGDYTIRAVEIIFNGGHTKSYSYSSDFNGYDDYIFTPKELEKTEFDFTKPSSNSRNWGITRINVYYAKVLNSFCKGNINDIKIGVGESNAISLPTLPNDYESATSINTSYFSSSNKDVATVTASDGKFLVNGLKAGTSTITVNYPTTAKYTSGSKTFKVSVVSKSAFKAPSSDRYTTTATLNGQTLNDGDMVYDDEDITYTIVPKSGFKMLGSTTVKQKVTDTWVEPCVLQADGDIYLIKDNSDWDIFAKGYDGSTSTFRLGANIGTVTTMVGTQNNPFKGTFDGGGYTLTVNLSSDEDHVSPFRYISGATVSNLKVAGNISSSKGPGSTGGLVGEAIGNPSTINNCQSSVVLTFTSTGDATFAGFLGRANANVTFSNCYFSGWIMAPGGHSVAGFVGWIESGKQVTINNCLSGGIIDALSGGGTGNAPFARNAGLSTVNNSYYLDFANINDAYRTGTKVNQEQLKSGEVTFGLQGTQEQLYWGQTLSGNAADNTPLLTSNEDKHVYKASFVYGSQELAVSYANPTGTFPIPEMGDYFCANGQLKATENITVNVYSSTIETTDQWNALVDAVAAGSTTTGITFRLANDISVTTMLGTESNPFTGTFDGQGHKITFNQNVGDVGYYPALFRAVNGATIQDLSIGGTLTFLNSGYVGYNYHGYRAGGLIGKVTGNTVIMRCVVSTTLKVGDISNRTWKTEGGGIAGYVDSNSDLTIDNCLFNGTFVETGYMGGMVGIINGTCHIKNSLMMGSNTIKPSNTVGTIGNFKLSGTCEIENSYYIYQFTGTYINRQIDGGTETNLAELASGKIAWLLQGNQSELAWGQTISGETTDGTPLVTNDENKRVYKASFVYGSQEVAASYANKGGTFAIPSKLDEYFYNASSLTATADITVPVYSSTIETADQWDDIVSAIAAGSATTGKTLRLANDITVTTMMGTEANPFQGIFDGQGHTLNVNYTSDGPLVAPFRYVKGATIRDLNVTGTAHMTGSDKNHCSGLIASVNDSATIERCVSSVALTFDIAGDAHSGGLVGHANHSAITIRDCAFTGSLTQAAGSNASVGGLIGWGEIDFKADIKNSYVDQTLNGITEQNNLVRVNTGGWNVNNSKFENCFYTLPAGVTTDWDPEPATKVTQEQMQNGYVANALQNAHDDGMVWGQNITGDNKDEHPVIASDSTKRVYKASFMFEDEEMAAVCANTDNTFPKLTTVKYVSTDPADYTSEPASENITVALNLFNKDDNGNWLISDTTEWNTFAAYCTKGNYRMTADIKDVATMAGTKDKPFTGTFDGQNHTLTVNYDKQNGENDVAPFSIINGATIKNLRTAGTITVNAIAGDAAGLVGEATGTVSITDCASAVNLTFTGNGDATAAGLIGRANDGTSLSINNCAFTGSIKADNGHSVGGFIGWLQDRNVTATISNSLVAADITANSGGNTGNATFARNAGRSTVTNCYYREFPNITYATGTKVTDEQLKSGSVAHDLQINQSDMHWGQTLPSETMPRLTNDAESQVFRVDFVYAPTLKETLATQFINRRKWVSRLSFTTVKPHIVNYISTRYYTITYDDFDFSTRVVQDYTILTNYTSVDTLKITNEYDWQVFANAVADGQNYVNARLENDVDVFKYMVGTQQYPYSGKFDGRYHTLTVLLLSEDEDEQYCAPFSWVRYAEINNLRTTGEVISYTMYASGLVGHADYVRIHNCEVATNIVFPLGGDMRGGGLVAQSTDNVVYIDKCAFNGTFSGVQSQTISGVAGFVGWGGSKVEIKNSYVHTAAGHGCQFYYPFINSSGGAKSVTLTDCFAADYGEDSIVFDTNNLPCTKASRDQVESGYTTYSMQKCIPEIYLQVEPVWGQKMDGTDPMPHVVGDNPDMKVIRNVYSETDSIYDNYFILDENKDNVYNMDNNGNNNLRNCNLKLKRKFSKGWNTLVLPIGPAYSEMAEAFGPGTKFATFSNDEENVIQLDTIDMAQYGDDWAYGNEPFLVYTQTQDSVFVFRGKMVTCVPSPVKYGNNDIHFYGSYAASYTVQDGEYFISGDKLWRSKGKTTIKGTRAYFTVPTEQQAKVRMVFGDDTSTGIDGVGNEE